MQYKVNNTNITLNIQWFLEFLAEVLRVQSKQQEYLYLASAAQTRQIYSNLDLAIKTYQEFLC